MKLFVPVSPSVRFDGTDKCNVLTFPGEVYAALCRRGDVEGTIRLATFESMFETHDSIRLYVYLNGFFLILERQVSIINLQSAERLLCGAHERRS